MALYPPSDSIEFPAMERNRHIARQTEHKEAEARDALRDVSPFRGRRGWRARLRRFTDIAYNAYAYGIPLDPLAEVRGSLPPKSSVCDSHGTCNVFAPSSVYARDTRYDCRVTGTPTIDDDDQRRSNFHTAKTNGSNVPEEISATLFGNPGYVSDYPSIAILCVPQRRFHAANPFAAFLFVNLPYYATARSIVVDLRYKNAINPATLRTANTVKTCRQIGRVLKFPKGKEKFREDEIGGEKRGEGGGGWNVDERSRRNEFDYLDERRTDESRRNATGWKWVESVKSRWKEEGERRANNRDERAGFLSSVPLNPATGWRGESQRTRRTSGGKAAHNSEGVLTGIAVGLTTTSTTEEITSLEATRDAIVANVDLDFPRGRGEKSLMRIASGTARRNFHRNSSGEMKRRDIDIVLRRYTDHDKGGYFARPNLAVVERGAASSFRTEERTRDRALVSYTVSEPYLCVVPPHVQPIISEDVAILVDMIDGELDRRHNATTYVALGHVAAIRKESGDVNVSFLRPAKVYRPLTGHAAEHSVDPEYEGA
ncbi:hypothetical protein WN48_06151 [Eufriesea mexicana]|uniref:Uncharacterized protein n=1 Tax=Eufriesea mexicana TaxID=516756 RepID=A0A310SFQ8_9HYME|nr:hypothetical protein WN48_06151 [Eufriesea mexicana]